MNNFKTFLITLTPLEPYFFGGERSFGGEEVNYFARSNRYPQQTAFLGAIRYLLLQQNGLLQANNIIDRTRAESLIGATSFHMDAVSSQSFGVITSLSPVLLKNTDGWYRTTELSHSASLKISSGKVRFSAANQKGYAACLEGYDAKKGLPDKLSAFHETICAEEVFITAPQIGIQKAQRNEGSRDEGFYKQEFLMLKQGFSFAAYITLKENDLFVFENPKDQQRKIAFNPGIMVMGGERTPFFMKIKEQNNYDLSTHFTSKASVDFPKLILISEAIVSDGFFDSCLFAVSNTTNFRQLKTSLKSTTKYTSRNSRDADIEKPQRSEKFNLVSRGSVFYFQNNEAMEEASKQLLKHAGGNPYNIGYNHFLKYQSQL